MSRTCPICNYESKSELGVKQHISSSHEDSENPYKSETTCTNCDKNFYILDSYLDMGKGEFCSEDCQYEYGNIECVCNNCGEDFRLHKNEYERRPENGKFCTRRCESEYKSVQTECLECGFKFSVKKSLYESGRGKYCSKDCYYKSQISDVCSIRDTAEYKEWKMEVKNRDGKCVRCGSNSDLHAHHIIPVSEDETLATELSNGETLCVDCHAQEHPEIAELVRNSNQNT